MAVSDFFLDEDDATDPFSWRAPIRDGTTVEPLIDGRPTFVEMERAIAGARKSVHLTGWIFRPSTPVYALQRSTPAAVRSAVKAMFSPASIVRGLPKTWLQLLEAAARAGAQVRVILADFDPIMRFETYHAWAWNTYKTLVTAATRLKGPGGISVICSLHEAVSNIPISQRGVELTRLVAFLNSPGGKANQDRFQARPGVWPEITLNPTTKRFEANAGPHTALFPGSHHQKTLVVDGEVGFCGGIDVSDLGASTPDHPNKKQHDISCRVTGTIAGDLERNFVSRWNREAPRFNAFVTRVTAAQPGRRLLTRPATAPISATTPSATTSGSATSQLWRTISEDGLSLSEPYLATNVRRDILDGYEQAIEQATKYIYIENQYLRDMRIADWIIDRVDDEPDLRVLIAVPLAPEELRPGRTVDAITAHGMALQFDVMERLMELRPVGGDPKVGIYSTVRRGRAKGLSPLIECHSRQLYLHSKIMLIDDVFAVIGSANANGRSFALDTEACIAFHDPVTVTNFRTRLWKEQLGAPSDLTTWKPIDYVKKWDSIAAANCAAPSAHKGFVVPHNHRKPALRGTHSSTIPDSLAEIFEPLTDDVPALA